MPSPQLSHELTAGTVFFVSPRGRGKLEFQPAQTSPVLAKRAASAFSKAIDLRLLGGHAATSLASVVFTLGTTSSPNSLMLWTNFSCGIVPMLYFSWNL